MSAEEENVKILRKGYEIWHASKAGADGVAHWMDLMSDGEISWSSLAGGVAGLEFTRCCRSKQEVLRYFVEMTRDWEMLSYTAQEFVAQGDRVVMLGHCAWKNRKTGKTASTPKADVIRLRDGKIVEFMEFYDTAVAIAATT